MNTSITADASLLDTLNGIPKVDVPANLQAAVSAGRRMTSIVREVVSLRRGAGKLTPNEYFYYRLWDPALTAPEKRRFVGKLAQHPMHLACNDPGWYAVAADKLLFHTLMVGSRLPVPPLLAVTQTGRRSGVARALKGPLKSPASCEVRRSTRCLPSRSPGNTASRSQRRSLRSFDGRSAAARRRTQDRREPGW